MKKIYSFIILLISVVQINSQVIYTDIPDTTIQGPGGSYQLDLDGTQTDFVLQAFGSFATGYTVVQGGSAGSPLNGIVENASAEVRNIPYGTSIGSTSPTWNSVSSDVIFVVFAGQAFSADYLAPNNTGYVGCKFAIGNAVHYGWVRVRADNTKTELTIFEYAYESQPGVPILAGDMGISTGIENNDESDINIYSTQNRLIVNNPSNADLNLSLISLSGQIVEYQKLNESRNSIDINYLPSGIYVVSVFNNDDQSFLHSKLVVQ